MRINRFVASASGLSRRAADSAVTAGRVKIGDRTATLGEDVTTTDRITLDGASLRLPTQKTVMLHKPVGYVTSRRQQGATPTIYALLPEELASLKPVGRLDRDTSGLLLLTNNGKLAQQLQHPSSGKVKRYQVWLDRPLTPGDLAKVRAGITLPDGISHMDITSDGDHYVVELEEGRNRQIRRSFGALGCRVIKLHRTNFGPFKLGSLPAGEWRELAPLETKP